MRRSRKPVWAVSSIEGSNPSLSAKQGVFPAFCRANAPLKAVADRGARGSTQASVGPTLRDFVPSTFLTLDRDRARGKLRWPDQAPHTVPIANAHPALPMAPIGAGGRTDRPAVPRKEGQELT